MASFTTSREFVNRSCRRMLYLFRTGRAENRLTIRCKKTGQSGDPAWAVGAGIGAVVAEHIGRRIGHRDEPTLLGDFERHKPLIVRIARGYGLADPVIEQGTGARLQQLVEGELLI